jgi:hypothetical protein
MKIAYNISVAHIKKINILLADLITDVGGNLVNYSNNYSSKLITAEEAVKVVKSGDRIFYSEFAMFPKTLDAALAKRIPELHGLELYSVFYTQLPKVVEADPKHEHIIAQDWHFGPISRRLADQDMCFYVPISIIRDHELFTSILRMMWLWWRSVPWMRKDSLIWGLPIRLRRLIWTDQKRLSWKLIIVLLIVWAATVKIFISMMLILWWKAAITL